MGLAVPLVHFSVQSVQESSLPEPTSPRSVREYGALWKFALMAVEKGRPDTTEAHISFCFNKLAICHTAYEVQGNKELCCCHQPLRLPYVARFSVLHRKLAWSSSMHTHMG